MRDIDQYSISEFLSLTPVKHLLKQWRNDVVLRLYLQKEAESEAAFIEQYQLLSNKKVYVVIAFEQVQVLEWLLFMAQQHIRDATMMVFDNSIRGSCREAIKKLCQQQAVTYLALPLNLTRHVNRSHGMAMTWVYERIIKRIEPNIFCFLDHDMVPVAPVDLALSMKDQNLYGLPNVSDWGWNLWAGYSMFKYQDIQNHQVNFLYDFANGLDTGGRNWRYLYQQYPYESLRFAESKNVETVLQFNNANITVQIIDDQWMHIGGVSYNNNYASKADCIKVVMDALYNGMTWVELRSSRASL